jgi:hypothetical protein
VRHPNLLLNREEIEQVQQKIHSQPWAAALLEKLKAKANEGGNFQAVRDQALLYVLTGEKSYADKARQHLLSEARGWAVASLKVDLKIEPEFWAWGAWGMEAWAYDLVWDTCSPAEREQIEHGFRADWIQRSAGLLAGRQGLGKEWFDDEVGVRMTMLGAPGTRVYSGDGPICDGPPYHRLDGNPEGSCPMAVVRREKR